MQHGVLFWITGLSGAGKTTIAKELYDHLTKESKFKPLVFLDGDELRNVIGQDLGYSRKDRCLSAMRNARLCQLLVSQGINVICATISLFHACQRWNREHIKNYLEIYVDVPLEELIKRDPKQIYSRALQNKAKQNNNVVGLDLDIEAPENPDLIIKNYGKTSPNDAVNKILECLLDEKAEVFH